MTDDEITVEDLLAQHEIRVPSIPYEDIQARREQIDTLNVLFAAPAAAR